MNTILFHCMSKHEVRTYFCNNGTCFRFYIQDLKYLLPDFFVKGQSQLLRQAFEGKPINKDFVNKYEKCKEQCQDPKFEDFYKKLTKNRSH